MSMNRLRSTHTNMAYRLNVCKFSLQYYYRKQQIINTIIHKPCASIHTGGLEKTKDL